MLQPRHISAHMVVLAALVVMSTAGVSAATWWRMNHSVPTVATTESLAVNQGKSETTPISSPAPVSTDSTTPTPTASPGTNTAVPSGTTPKTTVPPVVPSSPPPTSYPTTFYAGAISGGYTSCWDGILQYSLSGASVATNKSDAGSFTWRVELADGTVFQGATSTMPAGSMVWYGFPGTSSYPSILGTITDADDGDRARLVITSPNYSAGPWSDPVPAGSKERCTNGQM